MNPASELKVLSCIMYPGSCILRSVATKQLISPLDQGTINDLVAGEAVTLSGIVYTARDRAHKRLIEALEVGQPLPVALEGQTIYYAGPAPARRGLPIGSVGPTTASRMDPYTPALLEYGVKAMIGKGARSSQVKETIKRVEAVYFVATGGAAAYLAKFVINSEIVAFEDLGPEAIHKLEVEELPLVVGLDSRGRSGLWPDFS